MTTPLPERMAATLRADVAGMHAYAIQPSDGLVKLDAMENPFSLPPALQAELGERLGRAAINRYPQGSVAALAEELTAFVGLQGELAGCRLMLGNGSDELIDLLSVACDKPGATILAPVPGFVMYAMSAQLRGLNFVGVDLTPGFELDEAAMLAAIERHRPAITYIAYPNNPTANLWDDAVIDRIVAAVGAQQGLVVFDEAYQPFAARSRLASLARHDHVLVLRTLSKFGLAGVRLGYLCGRRELIDTIDKVRPPYNVSVLNAECARFALEHADEYARQAALVKAERSRLQAALAATAGVHAFPSEANMVLVRVPDSARAFAGMKARGVLVKHVAALHPLLANCLRLTVGTPDENDAMMQALKGIAVNASPATARTADLRRDTKETKIRVAINLDGTGQAQLSTGIGFFDHMLDQIARHGLIDLTIEAEGDLHIDGHHTVEDVGITLGMAFAQAVGSKAGITRYGHSYVPLDEALSRVVVDFSGRPGLHMHVPFKAGMVGGFDTQLAYEFFQGFANHALVTLHIDNLKGENAHHQCETVFKAFARALRMALAPDPRSAGVIPSTKGSL